MTDQTIPADKVREILAKRDLWAIDMITEIEALLPPPPRPTLADMTEEERGACQWMQCEVTNSRGKWILATPSDEDGDAGLVSSYGDICWLLPGRVTPRPDLPRMEWPGTEKPAVAPALPEGWRLADHPKHGRVIVTRPDPDEEGEAAIIRTLPARPSRAVLTWCDSDELTYIDQEADQ